VVQLRLGVALAITWLHMVALRHVIVSGNDIAWHASGDDVVKSFLEFILDPNCIYSASQEFGMRFLKASRTKDLSAQLGLEELGDSPCSPTQVVVPNSFRQAVRSSDLDHLRLIRLETSEGLESRDPCEPGGCSMDLSISRACMDVN
jgi:hypothetical protein